MKKVNFILGIILTLIPTILGLILFFISLEVKLFNLNPDMLLIMFGMKWGASMIPIFFGIMLISGIVLLTKTMENEKKK